MNFINIKLKNIITKSNIFLIGFISIRDKKKRIDRSRIKLEINKDLYDVFFPFKRIKNIRGIAIISNFYIVKIPINNLITENIHNKPFFTYKSEEKDEDEKKFSLRYSVLRGKRRYLNSRVRIIKAINTSVYMRQTAKNRLVITVRKINKSDELKEQLKINLACFISKFMYKKNIMMYEKEAEKYEESASTVYERLIDEGYKNVYYIIDRNSFQTNSIRDKYKKNLIYKYTFKHYLLFFTAKALIGSESPRACY
ncbi:MAG: hypothetical protein Q4G05_04265 [Clostridia bacterium]|nr:hypothetical protein [Clostridia bacterium]